MRDPRRDEDERARRAGCLATVEEDDVFALEDVERFGSSAVDVERRPETSRLLGLEKCEQSVRVVVRRLDRRLLGDRSRDYLPWRADVAN